MKTDDIVHNLQYKYLCMIVFEMKSIHSIVKYDDRHTFEFLI